MTYSTKLFVTSIYNYLSFFIFLMRREGYGEYSWSAHLVADGEFKSWKRATSVHYA